ncbi:MAG: sugar phosphate isomerase/epimerase, partial [Clostridiales bacterium]|nr:sugar phosphate isomerase/epimerase [Clostridiales bacterium]
MLKTCISHYSFIRLINSGKMNYFDVVDKVKELGLDAVEFSEFTEEFKTIENAIKLREYADKVGLPIVSHCTGANFLVADPSEQIAKSKFNVDITAALGAKVMRHDVGWNFYEGYKGLRSYTNALNIVAPAIREVAEYAQAKGVITMSENHGYYFQGSDRVVKLVEAVNHPNYRLLCDIGNFVCIDEDPAKAVATVIPMAVHVHVKDMFLRDGTKPNPGKGWGRTASGNYFRG